MPSPILPEFENHDIEDLLGEDPFGWSYLALAGGRERRVVKVLKAQATEPAFLDYCMERLSDPASPVPGTAEILGYAKGEGDRSTVCVMPFYGWAGKDQRRWQPTSLKRLLRHIPSEQGPEIIGEIAGCIAGVHAAGMFHGGVKPSSLYLGSDAHGKRILRLGGFGQIFMGGLQYLGVGDLLFYASPEQLETGDFSNGFGARWDVYAFGVLAYEVLTGHLPRLERLRRQFHENELALRSAAAISYGRLTPVTEHFVKQLSATPPVDWSKAAGLDGSAGNADGDIARALREVIESCLETDPSRRPASMLEVAARIDEIRGVPVESIGQAAELARSAPPTKAPLKASETLPAVSLRGEARAAESVAASRESSGSAGPVAAEIGPAQPGKPVEKSLADAPESLSPVEDAPPVRIAGEAAATEQPAAPSSIPGGARVPSAVAPPSSGAAVRWWSPFTARPAVKWQIAAVASMAAMLPLSFFAVHQHFHLREARKEFSQESAHLADSLRRQAENRRRLESQKEETTRHLTSELNDLENTRSELLGEAMLARQVLRRTQDAGDEFFRLVLENRDSDVPEFRRRRHTILVKARDHYEGLVEVYGDASDFIVSTADAYFYLGRIYREQGEFGKSLASFGEAERRYVALAEDDPEGSAEYVKNIAIAKGALGELSLIEAQYAAARHHFTESSRFWTEARSLEPSLASEAALVIHGNSLAIAECEFAIGRADAALDGARSVGSRLLAIQEEEPENDRVIGALARSFGIVGRILEVRGESELAKEAFEHAGNLYARAVTLNAAIDAYHLGLGNSLARVGLIENDIGKLEKSIEVLKKVVAHNPYETAYQRTLADVYGVLSRHQRDGGRAENAAKLEHEAIGILQPIIRANPDVVPSDVLYSYAQRLSHLAELLGDAGDFDGSRAPLKEAIVVLERISSQDDALAQYRRALARARGLAGFASLKSGDRSEAREHLELAKSEWESYVAGNPEDDDAAQAVRWTSDQLRALR